MKRAVLVFALIVLAAIAAGSLSAEDNPFAGTWKLNLAKSKFDPGPGPKSQTRPIVAQGEGAKDSFDGIRADGSPAAYSFETNYDGKDCAVTGAGMPGGADTIALKRINSHKVEATAARKSGSPNQRYPKASLPMTRPCCCAIRQPKRFTRWMRNCPRILRFFLNPTYPDTTNRGGKTDRSSGCFGARCLRPWRIKTYIAFSDASRACLSDLC